MEFPHETLRENVNIVVRNARTHLNDGKAQFTDYEVELKTNHIAFAVKHSRVRRRYSDFVWLRNRLDKDLSTSMPPVLPGRKLFGRFNKTFIKHRQAKLKEFLNCLVTTELFLSHAAVHLFLQTKLSIQEIENFIDTQGDENPSDKIITHSLHNLLLMPRLSAAASRERLPSRPDSGFDSCSNGEDIDDCGSNSSSGYLTTTSNTTTTTTNDNVFNDIGHLADDEDNDNNDDDDDDDNDGNNIADEDNMLKAVEESLRKLSMSSTKSPYTHNPITDEWDSSVEYLYSGSSDSESRCVKSRTVPSTPIKSFSSSYGHMKKRGSFRRARLSQTCSLTTMSPNDNNNTRYNLNRSLSNNYDTTKDISSRGRSVSLQNCFHGTINVTRLTNTLESNGANKNTLERCESGNSSINTKNPIKKPTIKRKISLNEYCIVKRDSYFSNSVDPNDFNASLDF